MEHGRVVSPPKGSSNLVQGFPCELACQVDRQLAGPGDSSLEVGGLDVCHEPGLEALPEALLDRFELVGKTVARQHQLTPCLIESVEGVKELLLGLRLARQELDVVDQEDVGVAVGALEG